MGENKDKRRLGKWGWPGYRKAALLVLETLLGVVLGLGLARLMQLPEEQSALLGTLTTLVTWLAHEAFNLPPRETRLGKAIHLALRMISLVGFILALQSLLILNGWGPFS